MRTICLIILAGLLLVGCKRTVPVTKTTDVYMGNVIRVIEYDSCEYVCFGDAVTHKGNCKYCAERIANASK